jgi:biopolymer transport protein ExbB
MKSRSPIRALLSTALPTAALLVLAAAPAFAQEPAARAKESGQSVLDIILHSGNPLIIVVWVALLLTSIAMCALIIQNLIALRKDKLAPPPLIDSLRNAIEAGNYQDAWETCDANRNYLANVLKAGLQRLGRGKEAVEDALAEHGLREAQMLRTRNSYLSVIGVVSPMIGLLGTVIGMIGAFRTMGAQGISNPQGLASAIGEVLLATASGLFIAIPAFIAYYFFRNRAQMVIVLADDVINELVLDIPYEEVGGITIGEKFSAPQSEGGEAPTLSMTLSTNCPICNGPVKPGENPCPHCGATLQWA